MLTHLHKAPQNKVLCLSSARSFIIIQSTTAFLIQHAVNLRRISVSWPLRHSNIQRKNISEHSSEFQLQFDLLMCQRHSWNAPCCCSVCSTSTDMCPQKLLHGSLTFSRHRHKLCLETCLIYLCSLHQAVSHGSCLCSWGLQLWKLNRSTHLGYYRYRDKKPARYGYWQINTNSANKVFAMLIWSLITHIRGWIRWNTKGRKGR